MVQRASKSSPTTPPLCQQLELTRSLSNTTHRTILHLGLSNSKTPPSTFSRKPSHSWLSHRSRTFRIIRLCRQRLRISYNRSLLRNHRSCRPQRSRFNKPSNNSIKTFRTCSLNSHRRPRSSPNQVFTSSSSCLRTRWLASRHSFRPVSYTHLTLPTTPYV